jgi:outer membrane lipoprotein SlyB
MKILALSLLALVGAGCAAQRPVLYPTERLVHVGPDAADRDIDDCRRLAEANIRATGAADTARETAIGGGIGAASGAVGGAIFGAPGTGAAVGAASGATAGLLGAALRAGTPSPAYQGYVGTCLSERGYRIAGWR